MTIARPASPAPAFKPAKATHRARGMTLVELMIVVIILGILASIGAVAYGSYIKRSRASEARTILAMIANREAAYRAEFNTYVSAGRSGPPTSVGVGSSWPASAPSTSAADWYAGLPTEWAQLGVRPSRPVFFRYVVLAGQPTAAPPSEPGYSSSANQDIWFVAEAYGDLNANGTVSQFHLFSQGGSIAVLSGSETE